MKLYKNKVRPFLYAGSWHNKGDQEYTVGIILEKKVDNFNKKIKVYQPIGTVEIKQIRMLRDDEREIWIADPDQVKAVYLSECDLEEVKGKERGKIIEAMKEEVDKDLAQASVLKRLIDDIGEVCKTKKSKSY